jgi:recombination protein RecR
MNRSGRGHESLQLQGCPGLVASSTTPNSYFDGASGPGPEDLTIQQLVHRIRKQGITELVMATNPTLEGDGTALFITNLLQNDNVRITRLARGIASGSVLEFANREMLADALKGRQQF